MTGTILKLIAAAAAVFSLSVSVHAQSLTREVCQSYINTYCLRCHPAQRICDGMVTKSGEQWRDTVNLMGDYGNLDQDIQQKVYACVNSNERSLNLCGGKSAAAGRPEIMTVAAVSGTGKPEPPAGEKIFRSIGPEEALRMLQARDDVIFLDVRTAKERSYGAIPGSKLVSIYALLKGGIPLPKDKPILLVCAVGGRSYMAGQVLSGKGYREVYNLSGGVKGWYHAGLPLTHDEAALKK